MIEHAQVVIDAHRNLLRHAAGHFEAPAGELVLGVIPTLAPYVLPWFLRRFASEYPSITLEVLERPTDELVAEINRGHVDAAILSTPLDEGALEERVLFYDPFYLYSHPEEPLMRAAEVDVDSLDPRKLWLLEDGHCVRAQVTSFCGLQEREHLGSVRFAGGSLETICRLIDASEGYTLIPETCAQTLSKDVRACCVRAFSGGVPTREISLVHHRRSWKVDLIEVLEVVVRAGIPRVLASVEPDEDMILPVR
nr:LysR substrate-binding domain-containing protein [Pseudenhygromyxa sp. WMMC2535]